MKLTSNKFLVSILLMSLTFKELGGKPSINLEQNMVIRNKDHLKHIYKTFVRSILEFSSTVWHNSLTLADRQDLERVQKAALKVILRGEYENYEQALGVLNLDSLNQRRESLALKFAKNALKDPHFSELFPLRRVEHGMVARNREKYEVKVWLAVRR